jgi:hypothetical protein
LSSWLCIPSSLFRIMAPMALPCCLCVSVPLNFCYEVSEMVLLSVSPLIIYFSVRSRWCQR